MILLTHAVVGAALGRLLPHNPWAAFFAGFASHFALDAVPHWQYAVYSKRTTDGPLDDVLVPGRRLVLDMAIVSADVAAGFFLALRFLGTGSPLSTQLSLLGGAFGAVLPDGLQFLYWVFRKEPLRTFEKIHTFFHSRNLDPFSVSGMLTQAAFVTSVILASRALIPL